jgi:hypothetical protein
VKPFAADQFSLLYHVDSTESGENLLDPSRLNVALISLHSNDELRLVGWHLMRDSLYIRERNHW